MPEKIFLTCEKCGKRLLERLPNGFFRFIFGRKREKDGTMREYTPVDMLIHGSVQMHCISRECNHVSTFNYFPNTISPNSNITNQSPEDAAKKKREDF